MTMTGRGEPEDERKFGGQTFYHEKGDYFTSKEDAEFHARKVKRSYTFPVRTRIQKRPDGTYWVWLA